MPCEIKIGSVERSLKKRFWWYEGVCLLLISLDAVVFQLNNVLVSDQICSMVYCFCMLSGLLHCCQVDSEALSLKHLAAARGCGNTVRG